MNIITFQNVTKSISEKLLFESINFGINQGQKIALIGINGCGKSTLLKIISQLEDIDSGLVTINNDIKIAYLSQTHSFNEKHSVFDHLYSSDSPLVKLLKRYELACDQLTIDYNDTSQAEFDNASREMDRLGAWQFENEIKSVLNQLGIKDLTIKMTELSGGMLKKVALAELFIENADVIILDEPTNHLDIGTIEWLEQKLATLNKTILMVTHDRHFLNKICNTIIEIDNHQLYFYSGNYEYFLEKKEERIQLEMEKSAKIKNTLKKETEWLRRQPKARGTKQKARIDKIHELMQHKSTVKTDDFNFTVNGRRLGKKILELKDISKSFDSTHLIKDFTYTFKQNERIGIIGPNGSGKTTFLNILTGMTESDSGERELGINTKFAYFSQHSFLEETDMKVLDYIKEAGTVIDIGGKEPISASRFLEQFGFTSSLQYTPLSKLSGGEKRRLHLVRLLISNPNFLILDEPTNDLDLDTLIRLESFLDTFKGCVLVVSHDRYFMDETVDELLIFDHSPEIKSFPGNYSDYLMMQNTKEEIKPEKTAAKQEGKPKNTNKLSFNEKKEFESLETEIEVLEEEKSELEQFFKKPSEDAYETAKKAKRFDELNEILNKKMVRWEVLAERV
jgi:ABC transport system ATP-binding/permease protein